jgi:transposase
MPKQVYVDRTYPKDALERLYGSEHDGRVKERLLAILLLYEGNTLTATAQTVKVTRQTVTTWLASWNQGGYQGLKPEFSGGYAPRLSHQEWDQVVEQIKGKGYDIEQVRQLIRKQKAVEYSYDMVWYKLRKEYKLPYGKPYIENEKMPVDACAQIQKK